MDRLLQDVDSNEREHVGIIKEMFETLLSANKSNLALKFVRKVESHHDHWPHENADLFLAMVCVKLGMMSKNERKYSEGLMYFEMALEFFKKLDNLALQSPQEETTKKKVLAETLLDIALCCFELKEFDRANFFNKKVEIV